MDDMELANTGIRLGVDVGGTFTDIVGILPDGAVFSEKVLSSPDDYSVAIEAGVRAALNRNSMSAGKVMEFVHGATIATNAILTRSGARTALLTTKGFRDLLEIRRMRMPRLYDMHWQKPRPLVPRNLVLEVGERMDHKGVTCLALDEEGLRSSISQLIEQDVESIAVCFLLVPRNLVLEVGERMDHKGVTCLALDEEGLRSSISQLIDIPMPIQLMNSAPET